MRKSIYGSVAVAVIGLAMWLCGIWPFDGPDIPPVAQAVEFETAASATPETALKLMRDALAQFATVQDYRCTYLRDEFLEGRLHENHLHLKVRHEPFSVSMEWLAPKTKKGRVTAYVAGQNDDKMVVHEPVLKGLPPIRVQLLPEESKKRHESRHVITEAGLRNAMERCVARWEKDQAEGVTQVALQDAELIVVLPEHRVERLCQCVTLTRPKTETGRKTFDFYRVRVYFDRELGLPIRFETFDWPTKPDDDEGHLVERYTYLDLKTNVGLKDADFK